MGEASDLKITVTIVAIIAAVAGGVIGLLELGESSGYEQGVRATRAEAYEAGVAEWVVTGSNGQTEFRWKEVGSDERK